MGLCCGAPIDGGFEVGSGGGQTLANFCHGESFERCHKERHKLCMPLRALAESRGQLGPNRLVAFGARFAGGDGQKVVRRSEP